MIKKKIFRLTENNIANKIVIFSSEFVSQIIDEYKKNEYNIRN